MAKKVKKKNTGLKLASALRQKRGSKNKQGLPSASNSNIAGGWGTQSPTTGAGGGTSYGA